MTINSGKQIIYLCQSKHIKLSIMMPLNCIDEFLVLFIQNFNFSQIFLFFIYKPCHQLNSFNNKFKKKVNMPKNNPQWSEEEEKFLVEKIQDQIKEKSVNWENVSFLLNCHFSQSQRSAKQCRKKYIEHLKNIQNSRKDPLYSIWTTQELALFKNLYEQNGPSWTLLSTKFINKSESCLKNLFNNSLRRGAKILYKVQGNILNRAQKSITKNILLVMLNFTHQVYQMILSNNLTVNRDSMLFRFRSQILELCLGLQQFSEEQLSQLVILIKNINIKIRCFGIFKIKLSKQWRINEKNFKYVCQFDKVVKEPEQSLQTNPQLYKSIEFSEKVFTSPLSINSSFKFCEKLMENLGKTDAKQECDPMALSTALTQKGLFASTQILDLPTDNVIIQKND